jgi:WD40 repeat protein
MSLTQPIHIKPICFFVRLTLFVYLTSVAPFQHTVVAQEPRIYVESGIRHSARSIGFSRDSKFVATGSRDRTLKIWSVTPSRELFSLPNDRLSYFVTLHPTRPNLVSSNEDGSVRVWHLQKQKLIDTLRADNTGIKSFFDVR